MKTFRKQHEVIVFFKTLSKKNILGYDWFYMKIKDFVLRIKMNFEDKTMEA